jgi:DNA polymerase-3 subunit alpha
MGLFGMLEEDDPVATIPIPKLAEMKPADLMAMEKETTGIYISGHPMDDYRSLLRNTHVVPIGNLMAEESHYQDDQIVSVAGIVQSVKMKSTRNNSMMAYVTVEDDTASIEMLAFSNVLSQYGGYLRENSPVVITGRLSVRDDKEPQIVVNRARPMSDFANAVPEPEPVRHSNQPVSGTLYLRLPSEDGKLFPKIRAILNMFPGDSTAVVYFADTKQRRGTRCVIMESMLEELKNVLGEGNVVVK